MNSALVLPFPASRGMKLLIGFDSASNSDSLLIRVPNRNSLLTEMHRLHSAYGGVFAMNLSHFIETHECVPLFMEPEELLSLNQRILILIPSDSEPRNMVHKMYETFSRDQPLFMFDRTFHLMFVRAVLVLEYSCQSKQGSS